MCFDCWLTGLKTRALPCVLQAGAEMCGTLKNIVALGAGIVDGLDLGPNSKATIIRQGLVEMRSFTKALYPTARDDTFLECCGVGDLVATCTGGRNRLVAEAWTKAHTVRAGRQMGPVVHALSYSCVLLHYRP